MRWITRYGKLVLCAIGISALGVTLASTGSIAAMASQGTTSPSVVVANSSSQPVPTSPVGTTQISGSVTVSNTPTVNVAAMPTVSLGTGTVMTLHDARRAVTIWASGADGDSFSTNFGTGAGSPPTPYVVPAGQRVVVESVAASCFVPTGEPLNVALSQVPQFGTQFAFHLPLVAKPYTANGVDYYSVMTDFRIYLNPGDQLLLFASRVGTGIFECHAVVNGYTVDL
jgi:hypothetical protein